MRIPTFHQMALELENDKKINRTLTISKIIRSFLTTSFPQQESVILLQISNEHNLRSWLYLRIDIICYTYPLLFVLFIVIDEILLNVIFDIILLAI